MEPDMLTIDLHVYPGDARIKWPKDRYLAHAVAVGPRFGRASEKPIKYRDEPLTIYCRDVEHAQRVVDALNNEPEYRRALNTSLIDAMFLIWSLRLMTDLTWKDLNAFIYEAIGIHYETTGSLFNEADMRIGEDGGASRVEEGSSRGRPGPIE